MKYKQQTTTREILSPAPAPSLSFLPALLSVCTPLHLTHPHASLAVLPKSLPLHCCWFPLSSFFSLCIAASCIRCMNNASAAATAAARCPLPVPPVCNIFFVFPPVSLRNMHRTLLRVLAALVYARSHTCIAQTTRILRYFCKFVHTARKAVRPKRAELLHALAKKGNT